MSYTTAQMIQGIEGQVAAARVEATELERLQRGIEADVAKIDAEIDKAWTQLAETLIPAWDPAVFNRASTLLRLAPIAAAPIERRLQEHLVKAQETLQKLSSNLLVSDRENQVNVAQIRLAEIDEAVQPLQTSTTTLEDEPYFEELLAYRYGTEAYAVKFFQLLYYAHWKHADLVVEKHGKRLKVDSFADLAAKYVDEKTALKELLDGRHALNQRLALVQERARQVEEVQASITQAQPRTLALVRARVREHLAPLPDADVAALLGSLPDVDLAWRRIAGLKKKKEYLAALAAEQVKAPLAELQAFRTKLVADANKLQRPKNASRVWGAADWERRFGNDRVPKWQKRRERIQYTRQHIVEFHHYDRWNPVGDLLWWDVMSDGQLDGNFISEVRARPHHHVHHHHDDVGGSTFADVS